MSGMRCCEEFVEDAGIPLLTGVEETALEGPIGVFPMGVVSRRGGGRLLCDSNMWYYVAQHNNAVAGKTLGDMLYYSNPYP